MDIRIAALADMLKAKVEDVLVKAEGKTYLGDNKVVLTVASSEVRIRVATPVKHEKKVSRLTNEEIEQVKTVRMAVKGNLDALNVVSLLTRLKEELKRLSADKLTGVQIVAIRRLMQDVGLQSDKLLGVTQK